MGSNTNSPTPDPDEAKGAFRKPVNDAAGRKYRRRSSASPSASPEESLKQKEPQLDEDKRRKHGSRDDRVSGRDKSGDHTRGGRYVDEEDRNYSRLSSRSGRESRGGGYTDYKERGGDYNRSRDNYHYKDKYNRDRSDERASRDKYDDRDRRGRDRDYRDERRDGGRSSRDYRSDRVTTCEESRRNQDDSKAENRTKHLNDENKKCDGGDSKGSRERFQGDAPAKRNEESAVKRTKFSSDRNDPTKGSSQGQDHLVKDTPGQAVVNMPEPADDLDAAKVAAMKAAELVNKNLVGTGVMTADQKKKLLWGNKKTTSTEEPSHRWDAPIFCDRERQEKFNKLMGVKGEVKLAQSPSGDSVQTEKQRELQLDLEKQYTAGLRRRDGRTVGLGL
ncbi:hypothetical protein V2J09_013789 [Rumex salicifolius]